jgi:signal transduction histidine kinase
MTPTVRTAAIAIAALVAGALSCAVALSSDHQDEQAVWAVFGPAVLWNFVGVGLYAWNRRPERRIGVLMILLGFAWFVFTLESSDSAFLYTLALVAGPLWGSVFLHIGISFPSGRLAPGRDRALVIAGYVIFPFALVPALLFGGPQELDCDGCPTNVLLIRRDEQLTDIAMAFGALLYVVLFVLVMIRSVRYWRAAAPLERLQLTPVYISALGTFLLVTVAQLGGGESVWWAAFIATGLMPFAFLGGLLRSRVSELDAELRARLEELRASRARLVHAGDAARRRIERDLHDGAQSRLVGLSLLLRTARNRAGDDAELAGLLDRAHAELTTSLVELRELARGIHPAVLTEHGLAPALDGLVARAPVPVTLEAETRERLPEPVESAAYFVVSEALANIAKYAQASHATVRVRQVNASVTVDVSDDGVGGADLARGSGLRGLADRVSALDGTLSLDSPPGRGTRLRAEIPVTG